MERTFRPIQQGGVVSIAKQGIPEGNRAAGPANGWFNPVFGIAQPDEDSESPALIESATTSRHQFGQSDLKLNAP